MIDIHTHILPGVDDGVKNEDDSVELLVEDVLRAGAGLSYPPAVRLLAEEGPRLLEEMLISTDAPVFDRDENGDLVYGLEGAHSRRRIIHIGDRTGSAIMEALLARVAGPELPSIGTANSS